MTLLDWVIIALYMAFMIGLSVFVGRGQENQADYYVGGRNLPWWAVGISTMATQSGAISFISIPAFVALKEGGGLRVVQYEFALPLAMIFIMIFLIPFFRKLELISVYEYLEMRFNSAVRTFFSAVFLLSRGMATGVSLYAVAIVLSVILQINLIATIILIGIITLIYDTIGGMKAVVFSDVIQLVIMVSGIGICCYYAIDLAGGWGAALTAMSGDRLIGVDFQHTGLGDGQDTNFWALLFGGFFLYASYYGCDQSQTQRELSAPTLADTKRSLFFNGFCRFPLVSLYVLMGVLVGGALASIPEFQERMAGWMAQGKPDYMVPVFILEFIPPGIRALIFAAILAAAMSSLDSGLNSLSAATMRDFYEKYVSTEAAEKQYLVWSKITTVLWGVLLIAVAMGITLLKNPGTVLELINKVGSLFYGSILAAFLLGVTARRVTPWSIIAGIVAGVVLNASLAVFAPKVSWWWWNAFGCLTTLAVSLLLCRLEPKPLPEKTQGLVLWESDVWEKELSWMPKYAVLLGYFLLILAVSISFPALLGKLAGAG